MFVIDYLKKIPLMFLQFLTVHLGKISAHTLGFLAIVMLHIASMPTLIAVLMGHSDKLPPVDLMMFIHAALITFFFKSLIEKNYLYIATICSGFVAHTVIMSLILFK
jgi:hypothetical protein